MVTGFVKTLIIKELNVWPPSQFSKGKLWSCRGLEWGCILVCCLMMLRNLNQALPFSLWASSVSVVPGRGPGSSTPSSPFSQMSSTPYVAFIMLVIALPCLTHSIKLWVCLLIFGVTSNLTVFKPFLKVILRETFGFWDWVASPSFRPLVSSETTEHLPHPTPVWKAFIKQWSEIGIIFWLFSPWCMFQVVFHLTG